MLDSKQIRNMIRSYRNNLSIKTRYYSAVKIAELVLKLDIFYSSNNVGIFFSFDGEINTYPLILKLWLYKKNVFLPIVTEDNENQLIFSQYFYNTELVLNKFGILEPKLNKNSLFFIDNLDIIFVPLIAFNNVGNRLGMGLGFYDRTLSKKKILFLLVYLMIFNF
ncbi:MAG: 5-formyltetrahydrofolate cyclo-ligase [Buchnera aphidicola (Eriosoma harunire)]